MAVENVQSSRSTSGPILILEVMVWKMRRFSRREGKGNSIFRSRRPGRRSAGSCIPVNKRSGRGTKDVQGYPPDSSP